MNDIIFLRLESKDLEYGYMSNFTCLCWPHHYYCLKGSIRCTGSLTANNQFLPFSLSELITLVGRFTLCWRDSPSEWSAVSRSDLRTFSLDSCLGSSHQVKILALCRGKPGPLGWPGRWDACVFTACLYEKDAAFFLFVLLFKAVLLKNQHCHRNTVWMKYFRNGACCAIHFEKPEKLNFYLN